MSINLQDRSAKQSEVKEEDRNSIERAAEYLRGVLSHDDNGLAHILTALALIDINAIDAIRDWVNDGLDHGIEGVEFGSIDIIALYRKDKKILNSRPLYLD